MTDEWPKTVRIGGREYEASPDMSVAEFTELGETLKNEAEKIRELMDAMGMADALDDDFYREEP